MENLKLMLVLCSSSLIEEVQRVLEDHHIKCYINISEVKGVSEEIRRLGTVAFPGTDDLFLVLDVPEKLEKVVAVLERFLGHCDYQVCLKAMILGVEKVYL